MSWGVSQVSVRFGPLVALDDVSLDAPAGQVTAVVGGDGAGKTTLLRTLVGAVAADRGEVRRPPAQGIGYLSSTSGTYPDLSVDENVEFAATAYGVRPDELRRRAGRYLDRTGLAPFGDRLAGNLSGGMRQKLGVIRALLHQPALVILDEPSTGVDPVSRADLWWLMAQAAADGAAVVFTTTYLDEAERASSLLVLDAGRPLAVGTPGEIVASVPGTIRVQQVRPKGREAWRRGAAGWHVWKPKGDVSPEAEPFEPDLQDAVIALALERGVDNGGMA